MIAAAEMVACALQERGIRAGVLPPVSVSQEAIGQLDLTGTDIVCLSYLEPQPYVFAKYVSRRVKRREPRIRVVSCAWNVPPRAPPDDPAVRGSADAIAVTLADTLRFIESYAQSQTGEGLAVPTVPAKDQERLNALRKLRLSSGQRSQLDAFATKVADAFGVQIALVSFLEVDQLSAGGAECRSDLDFVRKSPQGPSVCAQIVAGGEMVVVEDVERDPAFASNSYFLEKGIRFYAGAPLLTSSGLVLGSLCLIDSIPRKFSGEEQKRLQVIAEELMAKIEAECMRNGVGAEYLPCTKEAGRHTSPATSMVESAS